MATRRRDIARRCFGAAIAGLVLAGVVGGPVGAARPTTSGPEITGLAVDGNCRVTMTYSAKGGKLGEVDMYAQTWGYGTPDDNVPGYEIWAGSTWAPANMVRGSANVSFQLAPGGRLKEFTYYGWLYGREIGTYKDGTLTPYYTFRSTCVVPDYLYTVKFHDGFTSGDAGFYPGYQQRLRFGQLLTEPTPPTRSGYVFTGWVGMDYGYLGRHPATGVWDFSTDTMTDYDPLVMYAQWEVACASLSCADPG